MHDQFSKLLRVWRESIERVLRVLIVLRVIQSSENHLRVLRVIESIESDFKIINEVGTQIYYERILFEKGNQLKDLTLKIPTDALNGLNLASISPLRGEAKIENNTFSFRGNLLESVDDILLITGALSQNSIIIKRFLDEIVNTHIYHIY